MKKLLLILSILILSVKLNSQVAASIQLAGGDNTYHTLNATKVPLVRQVILNTITGQYKIGDGVTQLQNLPYIGLNGTGFVKATGTVISYDNSTYPTTSAVSTSLAAYQPSLNGTGFVKTTGTVVSYDNTTYAPITRSVAVNNNSLALSANIGFTTSTIPTGVKTANYSASIWDFIPCDVVTVGSFTITLPTAPIDGAEIGAKIVSASGTNIIVVKTGGSDVFNRTAGPTSGTITLPGQAMNFRYKSSTGIWYVINGDIPLNQLDARFTSTAVASASYVPYTGATTSVNIGSNTFSTTGNVYGGNVIYNNGNTFATDSSNFIGSSNTVPLIIKINGTQMWKMDKNGHIGRGFGTSTLNIGAAYDRWGGLYNGGATATGLFMGGFVGTDVTTTMRMGIVQPTILGLTPTYNSLILGTPALAAGAANTTCVHLTIQELTSGAVGSGISIAIAAGTSKYAINSTGTGQVSIMGPIGTGTATPAAGYSLHVNGPVQTGTISMTSFSASGNGTVNGTSLLSGTVNATGTVLIGSGTYGTDNLHNLRVTKGTSTIDIGEASSGQGAIWVNVNPTSSNYIIKSDGGSFTLFNDGTSCRLSVAGSAKLAVTSSAITITDGINEVYGTGTGTKHGTATNQLQSFWNATPVVQPSAITTSQGLYTAMSTIGLIASGTISGISSYAHTITTPTTGGTVSLVNNQYNIVNPAGALLALTVNLPSSPSNNDVVYIKYQQNVTTVTYTGGTVNDAITAPTLGSLIVLVYDSGTGIWY